jgi:hypothetical protein
MLRAERRFEIFVRCRISHFITPQNGCVTFFAGACLNATVNIPYVKSDEKYFFP